MGVTQRIVLGKVVGVHGLQGWLKVHSDTDPREAIGRYPKWLIGANDSWQLLEVETVRRQGKRVLGKLAECGDRECAEELIGKDIAVERSDLDELPQGQFYWCDLVGLRVANVDGVDFGKVVRVFDTGANDVIVARNGRERLIPWIDRDVVLKVDFESGELIVDWDPEF